MSQYYNYRITLIFPFFFLDKDLDKLLSLLKSPEKQTGWTEICGKLFCKVMKARPEIISGTSEYDLLS